MPATAEAAPLDRLSPAGERCRVSDRVGNGWHRVSDDGRGKSPLAKQKSGHSGGQAECPVFVFFASAVVPNTAGAAPEAAEQTVLPLPVEKRKEWRNGAERLQTLLFSGATRLELANHRCENRIPQTVSLVNP